MSDATELDRLLRVLYPQVLGRVLRHTRDLEAAEDALQDAVERALKTWPERGQPDAPAAWLLTVARNRHTDRVRRIQREEKHSSSLSALAERRPWSEELMTSAGWGDELLRLVFTCCDPELAFDERTALTLSTVVGLSTVEVARAFLVAPRAMEQRLTRAKRRLKERKQEGYEVPGAEVAGERLPAVLAVLHLLYNEGYWSADNTLPIRRDLCRIALSLARSIVRLLPEAWEAQGLVALCLFHESRADARLDGDGSAIPLPEQDRSLWDQGRIQEANRILENALGRGEPGPFQVEAAIAGVHTGAARAEDTDWQQISDLYGLLYRFRPTAVVRLNQAFAELQAHGVAAAEAILAELEGQKGLESYPYTWLVRAMVSVVAVSLKRGLGQLRRAQAVATNDAEEAQIRRQIRQQMALLEDDEGPTRG